MAEFHIPQNPNTDINEQTLSISTLSEGRALLKQYGNMEYLTSERPQNTSGYATFFFGTVPPHDERARQLCIWQSNGGRQLQFHSQQL